MFKPIKITDANAERINEYIAGIEGRSRERCVTYEMIVLDLVKIEKALGIPKKWLEGVSGSIDHHAQSFPRSYRYTPMSTIVYVERKSGSWWFLGCDRDPCAAPGHAVKLELTLDAERALVESRRCFGL